MPINRLMRMPRMPRMSQREYHANLDGLNILFGAVLGFVLAGSENLDPFPFGVLLTLTAGIVVGILYISSSKRRLVYALFTAVATIALPRILQDVLPQGNQVPRNLQPTLIVWILLTAFVEFMPRERPADDVV